jgi:hypothetical protein
MTVADEIEQALSVLVGLPLWALGRAVDLVWFEFGGRRTVKTWKGTKKEVGDYALHVQCAWRIKLNDRIVIGRGDIFCEPEESDEPVPADFDWQKSNRFDRIAAELLQNESRQLMVRRVDAGDAGGVTVLLDDGYKLEIFPQDSGIGEYWRFFKPATEEPHLVFSGKGLER